VSYNASAVKIYNATGSLVHFENKKLFCNEKLHRLQCTTLALHIVVIVNLKVVGLVPGFALFKFDQGCQMVYFHPNSQFWSQSYDFGIYNYNTSVVESWGVFTSEKNNS
jgi:hypothetical protein